jgi:crotonobetainyl-CoA:carnitine CoA-transferase CaiB-like acyl-CoA transferase
MVAVGNQRLWHQFCQAIGQPQLDTDPRFVTNTERMRHRDTLKTVLNGFLGSLTRDLLIGRLRAHAVPCGEVRTVAEALSDPQLAAREMVVELPHPELGSIRSLGNPIKLSRTPAVLDRPPPALGQHTTEVLEALGMAISPALSASGPPETE